MTELESDFVPAAGEGMEENERRVFVEAREGVAGGKRTTQRIADLGPGAFGQLEVTLDGVFAAIHLGPAMIKKREPSRPSLMP